MSLFSQNARKGESTTVHGSAVALETGSTKMKRGVVWLSLWGWIFVVGLGGCFRVSELGKMVESWRCWGRLGRGGRKERDEDEKSCNNRQVAAGWDLWRWVEEEEGRERRSWNEKHKTQTDSVQADTDAEEELQVKCEGEKGWLKNSTRVDTTHNCSCFLPSLPASDLHSTTRDTGSRCVSLSVHFDQGTKHSQAALAVIQWQETENRSRLRTWQEGTSLQRVSQMLERSSQCAKASFPSCLLPSKAFEYNTQKHTYRNS